MIEIRDKKDCCGCWACENACPKGCISMAEDGEGFRYPTVDKDKCIDCGLCEKVCPIINVEAETEKPQRAYLLQHKDEKVLSESTSGGAFTAIASCVIEQGGVVFGAAYDKDFNVVHTYTDSIEELRIFRNSKYVQSLIGDCYEKAKEFLKQGRMVCFSGTPCQIEGLLRYLRKPYDNLLTVDLVCHAITSPKVFRMYVDMKKGETAGQIDNIMFRDKKLYGYKYSTMSVYSGGKQVYHAGIDTDAWLRSFFSGINVRPSCYNCRFKKRYRQSDITIWDCFEPDRFCKELDNDRGVTRVLAHTTKGENMMTAVRGRAMVVEHDADAIVKGVKQMTEPTPCSPRREAFFSDIDTMEPSQLFTKYFPITVKNKVERTIRLLMLRLGLYKQLKRTARLVLGEIKR